MSASVDSQFSHKAFGASLGGVTHPILSDFHPKGQVAEAYGVYNEEHGFVRRSVFIIDKDGIVRYKQVYSRGLPNVEEILAEVDKL